MFHKESLSSSDESFVASSNSEEESSEGEESGVGSSNTDNNNYLNNKIDRMSVKNSKFPSKKSSQCHNKTQLVNVPFE
jgi:hypothetical protein